MSLYSVLPRPFSEGGTPCRFLVTPCPFQEAEMTPCPFLGDAQRRPVTFYLTPNVTVHGNRRGNYAARTFPLFYSTAFVIVIRLVYKNLRYWPIRIYFGRLAIDCCDKNMAAISCLYFGYLPFYKDWINVRLRLCYCCSALCLTLIQSWGTLLSQARMTTVLDSAMRNSRSCRRVDCRVSWLVTAVSVLITHENQNAILSLRPDRYCVSLIDPDQSRNTGKYYDS